MDAGVSFSRGWLGHDERKPTPAGFQVARTLPLGPARTAPHASSDRAPRRSGRLSSPRGGRRRTIPTIAPPSPQALGARLCHEEFMMNRRRFLSAVCMTAALVVGLASAGSPAWADDEALHTYVVTVSGMT
jgi:hypothetical protein